METLHLAQKTECNDEAICRPLVLFKQPAEQAKSENCPKRLQLLLPSTAHLCRQSVCFVEGCVTLAKAAYQVTPTWGR